MKKNAIVVVLIMLWSFPVFAKDLGLGVSFQSGQNQLNEKYKAMALSIGLDIDRMSIIGEFAPFGDFKLYAGKLIFRPVIYKSFNLYGFVEYGSWIVSGTKIEFTERPGEWLRHIEFIDVKEITDGYVFGGGIEHSWKNNIGFIGIGKMDVRPVSFFEFPEYILEWGWRYKLK